MASSSNDSNVAKIVANIFSCPPGVHPFTRDQVNALYYFKNRLVASMHHLYTKVPEEAADAVIARLLKDVLAEIERGDN